MKKNGICEECIFFIIDVGNVKFIKDGVWNRDRRKYAECNFYNNNLVPHYYYLFIEKFILSTIGQGHFCRKTRKNGAIDE